MNSFTQITEPADDKGCEAIGITIIYEDRPTGLIAKRFSDMLIASLGVEDQCTLGCWRTELIDLPEIAEEIARDAAACEFIILSLRGDTGLSMGIRDWIGTWLAGATGRPACLVALFDPSRSRREPSEGARFHLRQAAAEAGVGFFAHCAVAPGEAAGIHLPTSDKRARATNRSIRFCDRMAQFFPTTAAA